MPANKIIQLRRGTSQQWNFNNPILSDGECGFETNTFRLKIGNGTSTWSELDYVGSKEFNIRVKNTSGQAIYKCQSVYFDSHDDDTPTIRQFLADNTINKQKFCGLVDNNIMNNNYGTVIYNGIISGLDTRGIINTNFSSSNENWSNGDILYADPFQHGKITKIRPQNSILIGVVLNVHINKGSILVKPFINPSLSSLSDMLINNISEDDIIKYHQQDSLWKNVNFLDGGLI